jgi:hypothetical protein
LSNLKILKRYRQRSLMGVHGANLVDGIRHFLPASADELAPQVAGGHTTVFALIAAGHLSCDLDLPFEQAITHITAKIEGAQK